MKGSWILRWFMYVLVALIVADVGILVVQGVRGVTRSSMVAAVNSMRSSYEFAPLKEDPSLDAFASSLAVANAFSRQSMSVVGFEALKGYEPTHIDTMEIDSDDVKQRILGVSAGDALKAFMSDKDNAEALRRSYYRDIGVGISKQKSGILSIVIVVAQRKGEEVY